MRVLVVTNLYPPHYHGGYEVRCSQVAEGLRAVGHTVRVLTSRYGVGAPGSSRPDRRAEDRNGIPVNRGLDHYRFPPQPAGRPWRVREARRELADARLFTRLLREFRPEIVSWWNMYGLSKLLLGLPRQWGIPDVHWIEDAWMIEDYSREGEPPLYFWSALWDGRWGPRPLRPLVRVLSRGWEGWIRREGIPTRDFSNRPAHVCFVSEHMRALYRRGGLEFASSEVIHGGVSVDRFYRPLETRPPAGGRLRMLYVGQLTQDRGLHTLIEALDRLDPGVRSRLELSVVGEGQAAYERRVKQQAAALRMVTFLGKVQHDEMPQVYERHDVLVFPSMRDEGLPLTVVEAMLGGCAVVTTGSGGAMEVARAADLPLFPKGDAEALSDLLTFLSAHPQRLRELAARGQKVAARDFSFDRMLERWLATLERLRGLRMAVP